MKQNQGVRVGDRVKNTWINGAYDDRERVHWWVVRCEYRPETKLHLVLLSAFRNWRRRHNVCVLEPIWRIDSVVSRAPR